MSGSGLRFAAYWVVAGILGLTACNGDIATSTSSTTLSVSLSASPTSVTSGGSSTLSWSSSNATSCTASNTASNSAWTGAKIAAATTSTQTLSNLTVTGTYTLTCTGNGHSASQSVTITTSAVVNPTTVSLYASPSTVLSGEAATLTWSSDNANSCNASGAWSGSKATSGSQSTGALSTSQTYTLTCTGTNGNASQTTIVTVGVPPPLGFVASLDVVNTSGANQTNVSVTFGQAFKAGDVPAGVGLSATATLSDGTHVDIPLQLDAKATHPGNSLRHGILTLNLPTLAAGATQTVRLSTTSGSNSSGTPVSLSALLATSFDATVSLNVSGVGGGLHSASAKELLRALPATIPAKNIWLSGQQVSEWIVGGPVTKADGTPHPHLTAYFHVRAYAGLNRVRVDTVIENNWTLVSGPQDFTYDVTLAVVGVTTYSQTALTHYTHARWHKQAWWGSDPQLYAKLDTTYLQDSKAIPKYETLTPTEAFLNSVRLSTPPMDNGDQPDYMPSTGAADSIGPLPRWDAVYAVSGDRRAYNYMLANADGGAAYSSHFRDELTKFPVTIDSYPNSSLWDPAGSSPVIPESASANPYVYDGAHQPSIGYTAYLVTGDYFYLEEMQFWSATNLISTGSYARGGSDAYKAAASTNGSTGIWYTGSLRWQAWAYRSLLQAASITPDTHGLKNYFTSKLNNNLAYDTWQYADAHSAESNSLGMMYQAGRNDPGSSIYGEYRMWFDNFISWAYQYAVDLGYRNAIPMRDYKAKTAIGMMGLTANESCFQFVPQYVSRVGPLSANPIYYASFKEVYEATVNEVYKTAVPGATTYACGSQAMADFLTRNGNHTYVVNEMTGGQNSVDYYFAPWQMALAAAVDSGLAGGPTAWNRSLLSGIHPDYRDMPVWALVPRNSAGVSMP
jgi:hypothetical protein